MGYQLFHYIFQNIRTHKSLRIVDCIIIPWNKELGIEYFLEKYSVLTFSAETSHSFHLNATRVFLLILRMEQFDLWRSQYLQMILFLQKTEKDTMERE